MGEDTATHVMLMACGVTMTASLALAAYGLWRGLGAEEGKAAKTA